MTATTAPADAPMILVVDDDPVSRMIVEDSLGPLGYATTSVGSAQDAIAYLRSHPLPDVVVSDVSMPGMSGFEFCRTIREHEDWRHLPLVFITAYDDREARLEAIDLGADDLLSKPIDLTELAARVRAMVQLSRYRTAEGRRQRLDEVLGQIGEGIVLLTPDGRILRTNEGARRLLDLPGDVDGSDLDLTTHLADTTRFVLHSEHALDLDAQHPQEVTYARPRGELTGDYYVDLRCAPVQRAGTTDTLVLTVRDGTARLRGQSAAAVVVDTINHKFRTPLTGVVSALQLMDGAGLEPPMQRLVEVAKRGADRLATTLTHILEYATARASGNPAHTVRLETDRLVDQLDDLLHGELADIAIDVDLPDTPLTVRHDALVVALGELTANARANASSPAAVRVRLRSTGNEIEVVVTDDGPGFPAADEGLIFEQFYQVDVSGNGTGAGLGLPLARLIVEDAGGRIWASSRSDGPTTFGFTLPLLHERTAS